MSIHRSKTYCLKCEKPNMGCKCLDKSFTIEHSHKLRVPLSTNNRVQFRKFLAACPPFVNCVPDELIPHFRNLLIKVKYFNKKINGRDFTFVTKKDKMIKGLYD